MQSSSQLIDLIPMAAEAVSSAVAGEAVSAAVNGLLGSSRDRMEESECMERLEAAHLKMEAAVEASNRWQITDVPLLRWRNTLKRATQECDDDLRSRKRRALENEEKAEEVRRSRLPGRIAHAATSFMSSFFSSGGGRKPPSSGGSTVRRFERYADGAEQFLKFVHFSIGAAAPPPRYGFFHPLAGRLLGGKFTLYETLQGGRYRHFAVDTVYSPDRGMEARVRLVYADSRAPTESFLVCVVLRLSESVDVIGVVVKSLQSMASRRKLGNTTATDIAIRELVQLPTQDFRWCPQLTLFDQKESNNVHSIFVQRFRPDPFCCNDSRSTAAPTRKANTLSLSELFPESVIKFAWHRYVSLSDDEPWQNKPRCSSTRCVRLHTYVMPHDSPMDFKPTHESCASELVNGAEQEEAGMIQINVGLDELEEVVVQRAVDHLCCTPETTMYQVIWKSKHGTAQINLEKVGAREDRTILRFAGKKGFQPQDYLKKTIKQLIRDQLGLWIVRSSIGLEDAILAWIKKVDHCGL